MFFLLSATYYNGAKSLYQVAFDYFYTLDFSGILRNHFKSDVSFAVFRTTSKYNFINASAPLYIIDLVTFFCGPESNHN